jgi:hypothetical protein
VKNYFVIVESAQEFMDNQFLTINELGMDWERAPTVIDPVFRCDRFQIKAVSKHNLHTIRGAVQDKVLIACELDELQLREIQIRASKIYLTLEEFLEAIK